MTANPRISIIITSFRRETYLTAALQSVRNQTLERDAYEVLVVTDAERAKFAASIGDLDVTWIPDAAESYGLKLAKAIRTSRGKVVAFLEDDDIFMPEKLEIVDQTFAADSELGYFHNNFSIIDAEGRPQPLHPFRAPARAVCRRLGFLRVSGPNPWVTLRKYPPMAPDFNCSSIAVWRECVMPRLGFLEEMPQAVESFLLLAAVLAGRAIALEPRELTQYRIHASNVSRGASPADALAKVRVFTARALTGYAVVARMARESGNSAAATEMEAQLRVHRVYEAFRESETSRVAMWRAWQHARELRDSYTWHAEGHVDSEAILYLTWPRLAQAIYGLRLVAGDRSRRQG